MTDTAAGFPGSLLGRASGVTDVVVLGGEAAQAVAADFALDPETWGRARPGGRRWLAVASQAGRIVGLAVARGDDARLEIVELLTSELGDRDEFTTALISAFGPLARRRALPIAGPPGRSGVLGLRERRN